MKKLLTIATLIFCSACTGSTEYGECVGLNNDDRDPALRYKVSVWNAAWSVIGFETVIAPVLWATDYAYCPVGPALTGDTKQP